MHLHDGDQEHADADHEGREPYEPPQLEALGTLAELTQGSVGLESDSTEGGSI